MTSRIYLSLIGLLFTFSVFAQNVDPMQRTLITKRTASWCPNCGTWGWSFFHDLITDNEGKAILIAAHYDGNLVTKAALEITDNFGGIYQPVFFQNHTILDATPFTTSTLRPQVKSQVEANHATAPLANAGFTPTYDGKEIKVNAKVKFFKAGSGEFYLGIYLLEDNLISFQSGIGNNATHMKVLRYSFTDFSWGKLIANGAVSANQEFNFAFALPSVNPAGKTYEVAGIIWKKNGTKYEVVNTWSTKTITTTTNTKDLAQAGAISVQPNVVDNSARISIRLTEDIPSASLELFDLNGHFIHNMYRGKLNQGEHSFLLNRQTEWPAGTYLLRFSDGKMASTEKIVFK